MTSVLDAQRYFEEVSVGEEFEVFQQPTSEQVLAFMESGSMGRRDSSDPGAARFRDAAAARSQGMERPIVPGNMSTAMITRIVTDWMGPLGRIVSIDVSFRRPVLHGDRLRCLAVVTDTGGDGEPGIDGREDAAPGIVRLDLALENERGERPVQGTAEVELPRRV
ncbi:MAG: MaoC family dehydratase [Dehalococcoidia bacterium]|nr:MaoC family dehydratase [Dehalococcoidia bacterium]